MSVKFKISGCVSDDKERLENKVIKSQNLPRKGEELMILGVSIYKVVNILHTVSYEGMKAVEKDINSKDYLPTVFVKISDHRASNE